MISEDLYFPPPVGAVLTIEAGKDFRPMEGRVLPPFEGLAGGGGGSSLGLDFFFGAGAGGASSGDLRLAAG